MIPLIAAAAASAAAGIASSIIGADASRDAAAAAAEQEQKALDFQKGVWTQTQANEQPYLAAGKEALSQQQSLINDATKPQYNYKIPDFNFDTYSDPSAEYRMAQAAKAINNSSIAKGLTGGGAIKALASKQQEMAGGAYSDAWNRYLSNTSNQYKQANDTYARDLGWQDTQINRQKDLATQGANVAAGLGTTGVSTGQQVGASYGNLGSSNASGIVGAGNATMRGITTLGNGIASGLGALSTSDPQDAVLKRLQENGDVNGWAGSQTNDNLGVA